MIRRQTTSESTTESVPTDGPAGREVRASAHARHVSPCTGIYGRNSAVLESAPPLAGYDACWARTGSHLHIFSSDQATQHFHEFDPTGPVHSECLNSVSLEAWITLRLTLLRMTQQLIIDQIENYAGLPSMRDTKPPPNDRKILAY